MWPEPNLVSLVITHILTHSLPSVPAAPSFGLDSSHLTSRNILICCLWNLSYGKFSQSALHLSCLGNAHRTFLTYLIHFQEFLEDCILSLPGSPKCKQNSGVHSSGLINDIWLSPRLLSLCVSFLNMKLWICVSQTFRCLTQVFRWSQHNLWSSSFWEACQPIYWKLWLESPESD